MGIAINSFEKSTIAINSVEKSITINIVEKSITINSFENSITINSFEKSITINIVEKSITINIVEKSITINSFKKSITINIVEKSITINSVEKSITINSFKKSTINSLLENTFNRMSVIKIAFIVLISVYISLAARAPDASDPVNFNVFPGQQFPVLSSVDTVPAEPRDGRQSVLGCLKGCTRELRPVRGEQGGREIILPNKCTFDVEA